MLNLPQTITKNDGSTVVYVYSAGGNKLRKLYTAGGITTTTEYDNGIEYDNSTTNVAFIQTEEGRARHSGTSYTYEYDLKDHLGNTRVTLTPDPNDPTQQTAKILQENDYYAFGYGIQSMQGIVASPKNEYLYNHKELQEETGLYDYGARFYDPVIGRWTSVDPLAEISRRFSPYNYVENNPIRMIDPDGMEATFSGVNEYYTGADAQNYAQGLKNALKKQGGDESEIQNSGGPGSGAAKADATSTVSMVPKIQPKIKTNDGLFHIQVASQSPATVSQYTEPVNYQDLGLRTTSSAIGANVFNTYGAVSGAFGLKAAIWGTNVLEAAVNGETSATRLGKAMHAAYKFGEADGISTFKEYTGIKGIRPDFVDFGTNTIYELKPNNFRAITDGLKQLNGYKAAFEKAYPGTTWKIVLDTY
ncbi:RHS repeat-associated core domain-containing protein [Mucilaginibacter sp. UC70_90]